MSRLLLLFLFLCFSSLFGAQFEIISEIEPVSMHMGLAMMSDELKYDNRGELGALVVVNCGLKDVLFQNSAMKITQTDKTGAYWVVMKQRAKHFIISREGFPNYKYDFPEPLASGSVYTMTVDEKNKKPDETMIAITSNQNGALVFVNGVEVGIIENRVFTGSVSLGEQEIELRKAKYTTKNIKEVITTENNRFEINLELALPVAVSINSEPVGATVYINNIYFGLTPKSSFFDEGTYPIRVEKEGFTSLNEEITISEPETKKYYQLTDNKALLTINTLDSATIRINGEIYREVNNLRLPASVLEIEVSHPKAEIIKQVITLSQKETRVLDIYHDIDLGTISIVTLPTTAEIELTGDAGEYYVAIGRKSFIDIPIGTYQLAVTGDSYARYEEIIVLTANQVIQKQITLEKEIEKIKPYFARENTENGVSTETAKDAQKKEEVKKKEDYLNRVKIGVSGTTSEIKRLEVADYHNDQLYGESYVTYNLSTKLSDYVSFDLNTSISDVYHKVKEKIPSENAYLDYYNLTSTIQKWELAFEPKFEFLLFDSGEKVPIFLAIGAPVKKVGERYSIDSNKYYNNYKNKSYYSNSALDVTLSIGEITKYISRASLWNEFKRGSSLSSNLHCNIFRDDINDGEWWQEVYSSTKFELAMLPNDIDFLCTPYVLYETDIKTLDEGNISETWIYGVDIAFDLSRYLNFGLNLNLTQFTSSKDSSDETKILLAQPRLNFYPKKYLELILKYDFEEINYDDSNKTNTNTFGLGFNWLFDF